MGLSSHVWACKRKHEEQLQDVAYHEHLQGDVRPRKANLWILAFSVSYPWYAKLAFQL